MTFREVLRRFDRLDEDKMSVAMGFQVCRPPKSKKTLRALAAIAALALAHMEEAEISSRGAWRRWTVVR